MKNNIWFRAHNSDTSNLEENFPDLMMNNDKGKNWTYFIWRRHETNMQNFFFSQDEDLTEEDEEFLLEMLAEGLELEQYLKKYLKNR